MRYNGYLGLLQAKQYFSKFCQELLRFIQYTLTFLQRSTKEHNCSIFSQMPWRQNSSFLTLSGSNTLTQYLKEVILITLNSNRLHLYSFQPSRPLTTSSYSHTNSVCSVLFSKGSRLMWVLFPLPQVLL